VFERFTDEARRTAFLGGQAAIREGRTEINPDDLVAGAIRDPTHPGSEFFGQLGVTLADVKTSIGHGHVEATAVGPNGNHFTFTRAGSHALQFAVQEADALGHAHVGWEHLLLGIIREGSSTSARILERAGALDRLRELARATSYQREGQQPAGDVVPFCKPSSAEYHSTAKLRIWTSVVNPRRSWWGASFDRAVGFLCRCWPFET
jgi:ATP-dependent Clp protease ATP-binding subunit ClpA